jgi:hypothetical protein
VAEPLLNTDAIIKSACELYGEWCIEHATNFQSPGDAP